MKWYKVFILVAWTHSFVYISNGVVTRGDIHLAKGISLLKISKLSIEKIPAMILNFLDWQVKAIVTVPMHSLLPQTDSTVNQP